MDKTNEVLSSLTVHMKYAKYLPEKNRRESWEELVERNESMHIKKYPQLENEIRENYKFVYNKQVLPSMRALQFSGKAIEVAPSRIYNCSYLPIDSIESFSETMFLLLGGTGVGYSVQKHHVDKLPEIKKPNINRKRRFLIGDSIIGWADAIKVLLKSYTGKFSSTVEFDYSDIRPKGTRLVTAGGLAPGPQPLKECIVQITGILDAKKENSKLTPLEAHDILCHIADAVLSGGIRRAAMVSLFNLDDEEMLSCKSGNWWETNPQRGRSNNSAVVLRHKITEDVFKELWNRARLSNAGEPGIFLTNDKEYGGNPCMEISLRPYSFCNLVEINAAAVDSQETLNTFAKVASFIATLQAGYTDFHYLREIWKRNSDKDSLIGVSMTGIASEKVMNLNFSEATNIVNVENERVAGIIGINTAARTTSVKPAGTTSLVLGSSSGIHAWHNDYYIRRLRVNKDEAIYKYLIKEFPQLIVDDYFKPNSTAIIEIPQKAPEGAILRGESALTLLERIKKVNVEWIHTGRRRGPNNNNVSATVSVKENEWNEVIQWMWDNREHYNGITVLPYDGGTYKQAPFENCTKEKYEELVQYVHNIDLTQVKEFDDNTATQQELACSSGSCELVY